MRNVFRLLGSLLLLCSFSWGTATVSGKLVQPDTTGTPVPTFIQFDLKNCGGNFPVVSGVAISSHEQFKLNSDGTWSQTLYKNDEVSCNGDTTSNYWHTTYYISSQPAGPSRDFRLTSVNCNVSCSLDGLTPLITYPVGPIAPATVAIGTTSTLSPGSSATVTDTGTTNAAILNFGIPTGATGATGPTGPTGPGFGASVFGFNSSGISGSTSLDTGISRDAGDVFDFGNGTALDKSASLNFASQTLSGISVLNGSSTITAAPPSAGTNIGWKQCFYSNTYCQGIAGSTYAIMDQSWFSIFDGQTPSYPANDAGANPDSHAKFSVKTDGTVRMLSGAPIVWGTDTSIFRGTAGAVYIGTNTGIANGALVAANVDASDSSTHDSLILPTTIKTNSVGVIGFTSTAASSSGSPDTALSRDSAGVVDVGNGTAGNASGTVKAAAINVSSTVTVPTGSVAVGSLAPGTSGQCVNTSGTSTVWGSCAGTAGEQLLFVDLTNTIVDAATNSFQSVSSFTGGTGAFNTVGKTVRFHWAAIITGLNTSQAFTPEILLNGGLIAGDSNCCTASAINGSARVQVDGTCSTKTTGASGSMQCEFVVELETGGTTVIRHLSDQLATINLTTAPVFQAGGAFNTTASTSNSINNIKFLIEQLN